MIPYFLMGILYLSLALLAALESSFSGLKIVPWFNGMVWLRVHLITLGVMTQVLFALMHTHCHSLPFAQAQNALGYLANAQWRHFDAPRWHSHHQ